MIGGGLVRYRQQRHYQLKFKVWGFSGGVRVLGFCVAGLVLCMDACMVGSNWHRLVIVRTLVVQGMVKNNERYVIYLNLGPRIHHYLIYI
jgi:hypothetical protein